MPVLATLLKYTGLRADGLMPHGRNGVLSVVAYVYKTGQIEILLKNPLAPSSRDGRLARVCSGAGLPAGKGRGSTH